MLHRDMLDLERVDVDRVIHLIDVPAHIERRVIGLPAKDRGENKGVRAPVPTDYGSWRPPSHWPSWETRLISTFSKSRISRQAPPIDSLAVGPARIGSH